MTSPVKVWRNQKKIAKLLGKTGKVISWTIIRVPPADFSYQAPYAVAVVELTSGNRLVAQLADPDEPEIKSGMKVRLVIRRTSKPESQEVIPYGIKAKPV